MNSASELFDTKHFVNSCNTIIYNKRYVFDQGENQAT